MPTTTKWIDRLKKDDNGKPFVRCWQVARDFKPRREGPRDDLFAAMPPLEAKKALFAFVAGVRERRRAQGHDEVKTHVHRRDEGASQREVRRGRMGCVGRISTRQSSSDDVPQVRVVVHGGDLTFAGTESEQRKFKQRCASDMTSRCCGLLGEGKNDVHETEILARNLTWTEEGLEYEGSDKHRRAMLEGLGLNEESKAVNSAAVNPEEIGQEEDPEVLDVSETKRFRSFAATLNFMSSDRSDVR